MTIKIIIRMLITMFPRGILKFHFTKYKGKIISNKEKRKKKRKQETKANEKEKKANKEKYNSQ